MKKVQESNCAVQQFHKFNSTNVHGCDLGVVMLIWGVVIRGCGAILEKLEPM